MAAHSAHPLSRAISDAYEGELLSIDGVEEFSGQGLSGRYDGRDIKLGSRTWCGDASTSGTGDIELWLDADGAKVCFIFQDVLREDTADVVQQFKDDGMNLLLVSGDRAEVVDVIAQEASIDITHAEQMPTQKFEIMEALHDQGRKVLMVGDGLNDAPVLAGADVSIAPGSAIDMAQNTADIVFMGERFAPVYEVYKTAGFAQKLVRQNFALAILYNFIAVPIALAGFVTPLVAALCMSGSSLIVIANSFRLRWMA